MKNKRWRKTEKGQRENHLEGLNSFLLCTGYALPITWVGTRLVTPTQHWRGSTSLLHEPSPPSTFPKLTGFGVKVCVCVCVCICSIYKCNCIIQGRQYMRPIYETPTRLQYPQTCTACLATSHLCRHICFHHLCHWCCVTGACGGWSKVLCWQELKVKVNFSERWTGLRFSSLFFGSMKMLILKQSLHHHLWWSHWIEPPFGPFLAHSTFPFLLLFNPP